MNHEKLSSLKIGLIEYLRQLSSVPTTVAVKYLILVFERCPNHKSEPSRNDQSQLAGWCESKINGWDKLLDKSNGENKRPWGKTSVKPGHHNISGKLKKKIEKKTKEWKYTYLYIRWYKYSFHAPFVANWPLLLHEPSSLWAYHHLLLLLQGESRSVYFHSSLDLLIVIAPSLCRFARSVKHALRFIS